VSRRQALRITAVAGLSTVLGAGLVADVVRRMGLHRVRESRTRMGTVVTITVVHPDPDVARGMVRSAFDEMARLEALLSRHRPDTPVAALNRTGALRAAPAELLEVLASARRYAELTGGAFDITVAPLLELYGATFARGTTPPSAARVERALALVDHRGVEVDGSTVRLTRPGMAVTLDGIAKGYVVDRTIAVMTAEGADRVLVNAGGDMATAGEGSRDEPWTVSVQDPDDERLYVDLLRLDGTSVATSGDYMRTFTEDRRFHHIVDPRTGYSPQETSSVTVLAATAMDADALSTTGLVLGPRRAVDLLESLDDVEGMIVTKDRRRITTSGLARHLRT